MADIYEIAKYFPSHISEQTLQKYINDHLSHLSGCYENKLYYSGYYHLHILYMVFIYIQIFRIKKCSSEDFKEYIKHFKSQNKIKDRYLKDDDIDSPFKLSVINEKSVFNFFYIIGFKYKVIKEISELINSRNDKLHANGSRNFKTEDEFDKVVDSYLEKMSQITTNQKDFLDEIYCELIKGFENDYKIDENDYKITKDDIELNFINPYYFSDFELKYLSKNKKDEHSKFIQEYCKDNY